jgi:anaerobic selenocysteine-containing dehydrogenase
MLQHCPSLAGLAQASAVFIHPLDLARVGVETGGRVRLTHGERSIVVQVVADSTLATGVASVAWGQAGSEVGRLIDATLPVTEVRLEAVR